MANESGRSWLRRFGSEFIDRAFLGNRAHDFKSGWWNKRGAIQGGISGVAGAVLGPLGQVIANQGLNVYNDNQLAQRFQDNYGGGQSYSGGSLSELINNPGQNLDWSPNLYGHVRGMTPVRGGWSSSGPAPAPGGLSNLVSNPGATINWTPNNWQETGGNHQVSQMADTIAKREAEGYGGGASTGGARYNAAVAAMGSRGTGGGNGFQWTGVSGDAARSVFSGMRDGSDAAIRHNDYLAWVRSQKR